MFGHRKLSVPARNSIERMPIPTPSIRRMKVRRLISPMGGPWTSP